MISFCCVVTGKQQNNSLAKT